MARAAARTALALASGPLPAGTLASVTGRASPEARGGSGGAAETAVARAHPGVASAPSPAAPSWTKRRRLMPCAVASEVGRM